MQATITSMMDGVRARVRRGHKEEGVYVPGGYVADLRVGDRIEVERQPNNPYLIYLRVAD